MMFFYYYYYMLLLLTYILAFPLLDLVKILFEVAVAFGASFVKTEEK